MIYSEKDFCVNLGIKEDELPEAARKIIRSNDFSYRILKGEERDSAILEQLKRMELDRQKIAAPERTETWEKGWNENLKEFINSDYNLDTLIPKFYRKDIPLRLNGEFVKSPNDRFEYDFFRVFRAWVFDTYFKEVDNIFEFGCGTGYNLIELAEMYPEKNLYGFDFVPSVIRLLEEIKKHCGKNINGRLFDMINPDFDVVIPPNSAIYTFGAIEQLGGQIEKLFRFFMEKKPQIVIHMEPTVELYDENQLIDYLSIRFHKQRGYTEGLLPLLQKYNNEGKIELIKVKRLYLGNYNMEGYNCIVWRPL